MKGTALVLFAAAVRMLAPTPAGAAGYALFEQGARALGTAGAFTATADDPSAIFFNPAGIARLQGTQLSGGVSPIVPALKFSGVAPYPGFGVTERTRGRVFLPPHLYATFPVRRGIVAGAGVYVPFGLDVEWDDPDRFSGRYIATRTSVHATYVNPTLAVELTPDLSVGAGFDIVIASAELERRIPVVVFDGPEPKVIDLAALHLEGDPSYDATFNAGLLFDRGRARIGLGYRHGVEVEMDGRARFRFVPSGDASRDSTLVQSVPPDQSAGTAVPFPASASLGVAVQLTERVRAEVDLGWMNWSVFDVVPLRFEDESLSTELEQRYEDSFSVRGGVGFRASPSLVLRGGYYFDETPVPSSSVGPMLPDASRHGITLGAGYRRDRVRVELFQMMLFFENRQIRDNRDGFDGSYDQFAWLWGASVSYAIP